MQARTMSFCYPKTVTFKPFGSVPKMEDTPDTEEPPKAVAHFASERRGHAHWVTKSLKPLVSFEQ